MEGVRVGGAPVEVTGLDALRAAAADGGEAGGTSLAVEALIAGGGALLVLAFVFASWMAVVPLLMALVAIPTTFLGVWPLASATDVSVIVKFLIALVGLVALPVPFLRSVGIAGMLIPLVSVAVAITLLPVVLATIGPRLDRRHSRREDRASRGWTAWARFVVRHRWSAAILSTAVLAGLVAAASTIQLGNPRAESPGQVGSGARGARASQGLRHRHRAAVAVRRARPLGRPRRRWPRR